MKKKLLFYAFGSIWLLLGLLALGFIGAADCGAPLLPCYIAAAGSGLASSIALFMAQAIALAEGWLDFKDGEEGKP